MKSITINGSKRESVGKRATKDLRNAGKVPCVLYGGDELVHFSATEKLFKPLVFTPDVFTATIELDGAKYSAILQDIQFHPVTDAILHVDFYQIFDDKELTMDIPVKLVGTAKGIMLGGALRHNLRKLKVKALPANLPDFIEADITELAIGSKLYVTELRNDKYALLHPDNTVVAQVRMSRNAAKAAAEGEEEEA
ncbi:50S ribosomal protein L25/general stress protein Ctc [Tenacibaculum finnmarkense genomovar finnmarkense]|uniref:50S ribosomal protein L25/general stress protein Ctc n=1 Tax=Tenacibaculum finnmarkense TaxID=2781243 RepID=UPI00187B2FF6|nr:50S ribosomal protein L25/general stress protein Ctc [Tenacibaculum finnmarkense]MBE7692104.1 50S ribosomal protein L25/general stress protein Ctc [Tenacibaculum finnmarkense genomovar finnmarkense]MCD8402381.1 50S ribosomal protein L25/general stress protein Ctc [Tenacibaculum finnmarkense genomovar finnmarkense]MCD8411326.1 50S ribosomal protein L25/general stress protein Ctc [Tenacibaculum finnmarkense genomovar ulcerans]MCD8416725.1 50S ribosomal protein L25/general stress protein Ctc [T